MMLETFDENSTNSTSKRRANWMTFVNNFSVEISKEMTNNQLH
jgi:hypothetical protein